MDPAEIKACCAASYSSDLVSMLLGDSYHPGGLKLTRHLLDTLGIISNDRVVDVASGVGTTSLLVASEYAACVEGVDLSETNVAKASAAADRGQVSASFHHGDAEALPLPDATFDAVVCECALCSFPDKSTAIREMARVLRPGGRVGITDVTACRDRLPAELTGLSAWIACVADACPVGEYAELLTAHGLRVTHVEDHREALDRMLLQLDARIDLLRMTQRARAEELGLDFNAVRPVMAATREALDAGTLGYALLLAEKPA